MKAFGEAVSNLALSRSSEVAAPSTGMIPAANLPTAQSVPNAFVFAPTMAAQGLPSSHPPPSNSPAFVPATVAAAARVPPPPMHAARPQVPAPGSSPLVPILGVALVGFVGVVSLLFWLHRKPRRNVAFTTTYEQYTAPVAPAYGSAPPAVPLNSNPSFDSASLGIYVRMANLASSRDYAGCARLAAQTSAPQPVAFYAVELGCLSQLRDEAAIRRVCTQVHQQLPGSGLDQACPNWVGAIHIQVQSYHGN